LSNQLGRFRFPAGFGHPGFRSGCRFRISSTSSSIPQVPKRDPRSGSQSPILWDWERHHSNIFFALSVNEVAERINIGKIGYSGKLLFQSKISGCIFWIKI